MSNESLLKCRFSDSGRGFGFAVPLDENGEDLYIPPNETMSAMHGDIVLVHKYKPGEPGFHRGSEGEITRILERGNTEILGVFTRVGAEGILRPENAKLNAVVSISGRDIGEAKDGDKVAVKITDFPKRRGRDGLFRLTGYITHVFGPAQTKEASYAAILHKNGIPTAFSDDALWEADDAAARPITPEGRVDCRNLRILTIDGADAKDLDDAVSLQKTDNGWMLGVHIADVSEYVKEQSLLDREAYARGTSVYFVDQVVPMLPPVLSNGVCSLNSGVDRYALSAWIQLDNDGHMRGCDFQKTIIRTAVRGVYSEVNDILEHGRQSAFAARYSSVIDMLFDMRDLYEILEKASAARGQLAMESTEAWIRLDENGVPIDILPRIRGIGERIIEQFMLCANTAAASWLHSRNLPCLYRIHEDPMPEKLRAFILFAHNMGIQVGDVADAATPLQLNRILHEAEEKGIGEILSGVLLRSLAKARYSEKAGAHYGLATELYCHFTSPIRRYPDLFVHRAISAALNGSRHPAHPAETARVSTDAEIRAVTAERQIEDLYMAQYCAAHLGEEYPAVISSVCSFGIFARTDKLFEGLVPLESLFPGRIRGEFQEETQMLSGGGITYRLGDRIQIRIVHADPASGRIDFALSGESVPRAAAQPEHRRPAGSSVGTPDRKYRPDRSGARKGAKPRNRRQAFDAKSRGGRKSAKHGKPRRH